MKAVYSIVALPFGCVQVEKVAPTLDVSKLILNKLIIWENWLTNFWHFKILSLLNHVPWLQRMVSPPLGDGWNREPGCTSTVSSSEVSGRSELQLRVVRVTPGDQHGHWTSLYGWRQVSVINLFISYANSSSAPYFIASNTSSCSYSSFSSFSCSHLIVGLPLQTQFSSSQFYHGLHLLLSRWLSCLCWHCPSIRFGLPRLLLPDGSIYSVCLPTYSWSRLFTHV